MDVEKERKLPNIRLLLLSLSSDDDHDDYDDHDATPDVPNMSIISTLLYTTCLATIQEIQEK